MLISCSGRTTLAALAFATAAGLAVLHRCRKQKDSSARKRELKLTYFDIRSSGEPIRLALAIAGIPFQDERIPSDADGYAEVALRRLRGLNGSSGTVPVLTVDGARHSQSNALLRFVGKEFGKRHGSTLGWVGYPSCSCGQLYCDEVSEAIAEIQNRLLPAYYGAAMARSLKTGEPNVPLSEAQRLEMLRALNEDALPSKLSLLEALLLKGQRGKFGEREEDAAAAARATATTVDEAVSGARTEGGDSDRSACKTTGSSGGGGGGSSKKGGPWFLGDKLSICDLACFVLVSELLDGSGPAGVRGAFVLGGCPALRAHAEALARLPAVAQHNAKCGYSPSWVN